MTEEDERIERAAFAIFLLGWEDTIDASGMLTQVWHHMPESERAYFRSDAVIRG
jgi:hypothetical protein